MLSIIYKSVASKNLSKDDVLAMLVRAKKFNRKNNITGYLFYHKGQFIQLFEGEKSATKELYERIKSDARHYNVETLLKERTQHKTVEDWYMAFYDISSEVDDAGHRRMMLQILDGKSPNQGIMDLLKSEVFKMINS